jgi:uncharacterized protein (DUF58 family)
MPTVQNVVELALVQRYRQRAQQRWQAWIIRRIPPAKTVVLDQRRVFIFPSRTGLMFLVLLLLMLVAAINYQNNMSFALTFLLANLFVVAVLHTFANLAGLKIQAVRATPVFCGQSSEFVVLLTGISGRAYNSLHLLWPESDWVIQSVPAKGECHVSLFIPTHKRGWHHPGRLRIETYFPLGLLRAWTWVDLDIRALVYPRPQPSGPLPGIATERPDGSAVPVPGNDDFYGLRDYQDRDSLRHVYWKSLAKGQPLQSKQYTAYADRSVWLDWHLFEGYPAEQRLSHLCYWVLEFDRNNEEYGLRLPGMSIAPDFGEAHRQKVLRQLALFGMDS